jgi:hypothetical protein
MEKKASSGGEFELSAVVSPFLTRRKSCHCKYSHIFYLGDVLSKLSTLHQSQVESGRSVVRNAIRMPRVVCASLTSCDCRPCMCYRQA